MSHKWLRHVAVAGSVFIVHSMAHAGIAFQALPADFSSALYATSPPGDASRIIVVEQNGEVEVVTSEGKQDPLFLDLHGIIKYDQQELGLLGFAFHPDYLSNGHFFVSYTRQVGAQIQSVVSRFTVEGDPAVSNVADPDSEQIKLVVDQPYDNHNGGMIAFGPDGYLYIAFGDGGSAYDPENRSQNLDTYIGKMLRVDASGEGLFTAPLDNPYVGDTPGLDLIWARGLRNPWRFSFDRVTGDLWLADVGQQDYEEVNFVPAGTPGGLNFGWRAYEGNNCNIPAECAPIASEVTFPIYTINHNDEGKSIIGGYRYRGSAVGALQDYYIHGDFVEASLGVLSYTPEEEPAVVARDLTPVFNPAGYKCCLTSLGEDADGELYVVTKSKVYKIIDDGITYLDLQPVAQATEPLMVCGPPGDATRLCIVQRNGVIRVMKDGALLETPYADLTDRVASDGELGLLGMAFHPDYATNGYVFLNYMRRTGEGGSVVENAISRFTVTGDPATALTLDPASELLIINITQPGGDHNGGTISFSPIDGYLYIPIGDGGCCNDKFDTALDLLSLNGKILRIDVDNTDGSLNYAIPPDNPYMGRQDALPQIWAYGLRNPFRSSFDRATGDFYFGDVGQDTVEKVGYFPASSTGAINYGWPTFEGTRCNVEAVTEEECDAQEAGVTFPIKEYLREFGSSVTGGSVYRGTEIPGLQGRYLYADYVSARVLSFVPVNGVATAEREYSLDLDPEDEILSGLVAVSEDGVGELYLVSIFGNIFKLVAGLGDDAQQFGPTEGEDELPEAAALTMEIEPARDATLYEDAAGGLANGTGRNLFSGRTGDNAEFGSRRSLLYFNVNRDLPPDAEIHNAAIRMRCTKIPVGGSDTTQSLFRVTRAWNEGPTAALGAGGAGAVSQTGDVTWLHTFYDTSLWASPGGDFIASPRATLPVGDTGVYTWRDNKLALDVTDWLADPASNYGWMLIGDETVDKTARRYDSREATNPANRPVLIVQYCGSPQDGWTLNPNNGHYYRLTNELSYADAAAQAECAGGYLATVNDPVENAWIAGTLLAGAGSAYIGYNDRTTEGDFVWLNGENALYENWNEGEPNDTLGEDAVQLLADSAKWNDIVDTALLVGVVERNDNPIFPPQIHTGDVNGNAQVDLSELLRVVQLYNSDAFHCEDSPGQTEDGYLPGEGANQTCTPHSSDYAPQDWVLSLSEMLRLIQLFNADSYTACTSEDGFCAEIN